MPKNHVETSDSHWMKAVKTIIFQFFERAHMHFTIVEDSFSTYTVRHIDLSSVIESYEDGTQELAMLF